MINTTNPNQTQLQQKSNNIDNNHKNHDNQNYNHTDNDKINYDDPLVLYILVQVMLLD